MPTLLGQKFPPSLVTKPPHMSPEDLGIYKRWTYEGLENALYQYFDVGVGTVDFDAIGYDFKMRAMWEKVNQKRIDALVIYPDKQKIIEFRHEATPNAIGRLLTYGTLYKDDPKFIQPIELWLVTNRYDKDVDRLCKRLGINYKAL